MPQSRLVIATAGTSIARGIPWQEAARDDWARAVRGRLASLVQDDESFLCGASAETHGLFRMGLTASDRVELLVTDTEEGKACADLVAEVAGERLGVSVRVNRLQGLQVENEQDFRRVGVQNLFATVRQLCREQAGLEPVLNATGGFKGVVPYLTLYGLLERIPVVYVFERSSTLLHLPPAPITFDFEGLHPAADALRALRAQELMSVGDFWELASGIPHLERPRVEAVLEQVDDMVALSALGQLVLEAWDQDTRNVLLSPVARRTLEAASKVPRGRVEANLSRLSDPTWRASKIHRFSATDLLIIKPGSVAERLGIFLHGARIYVAEIWIDHDRYEAEAPGKGPSDYDRATFEPWVPPGGLGDAPLTDGLQIQELDEHLARAKADRDRAEQAWLEAQADREEAVAREARLEARIEEVERELDAARAELIKARTELEAPRPGFVARLFARLGLGGRRR